MSQKGNSLLLVEDDALVRETLSLSLSRDGFEVIEDADGLHTVEIAASRQPHLILLDIRLPSTDGISLLRALKQNPQTARLPVVMLTNLTDQRLISECVQWGARGYLVKSELTYGEVAKKISEIVSST